MSTETQMSKTLSDFIRFYRAPHNLFSYNAKAKIAAKVQDILRHFTIGHYRSEPHQRNQNPAEHRIQEIKNQYSELQNKFNEVES